MKIDITVSLMLQIDSLDHPDLVPWELHLQFLQKEVWVVVVSVQLVFEMEWKQ
jgi:hypothetical protein